MEKFIEFSKRQVSLVTKTKKNIENVFVVWSCKTLQTKKDLLSTIDKGANYFEITYNGDKDEYYVDEYKKVNNSVINID